MTVAAKTSRPFPGTTNSWPAFGEFASFYPGACSLPPLLTTKIFLVSKCLRPVNNMAIPASFAARITSSSRKEPPGWIIAIPASAAISTLSLNGKSIGGKTAGSQGYTFVGCFLMATLKLMTRDVCPARTEVIPPFVNTIAFDLTNLLTFQANLGPDIENLTAQYQ